jgi:predicted nucleic acid-binding protein
MRLYLDTNIWIDIIEKRPGWKAAAKLLLNIMVNGSIVVSDILLWELRKFSGSQLTALFAPFRCERVTIDVSERQEALRISRERGTSLADSSHAILARNHDCVLVTRDKGFSALSDIAKSYTPEELL